MCESCGCPTPSSASSTSSLVVEVNTSLLEANAVQARANRKRIEDLGAMAVNLISGPGSGKTTLLEKTIERLGSELRIAVIEGDIETERDAERIRAKGAAAIQLTTGGACHLDAPLVHRGLHELEKQYCTQGERFDLLFIENVGNLVCPATFALGEHRRVILVSVPEGSDKPAKYPTTFRGADLFLITKTDLLPHFDFSTSEATEYARRIRPDLPIIALSATSGVGFDLWIQWLRTCMNAT